MIEVEALLLLAQVAEIGALGAHPVKPDVGIEHQVDHRAQRVIAAGAVLQALGLVARGRGLGGGTDKVNGL